MRSTTSPTPWLRMVGCAVAGCPFPTCEFWSGIFPTQGSLAAAFRLDARGRFHARQSAKLRHIRSHFRASSGRTSSTDAYGRIMLDLYRAVEMVRSGNIIVDGLPSKSPGHALVVSGLCLRSTSASFTWCVTREQWRSRGHVCVLQPAGSRGKP